MLFRRRKNELTTHLEQLKQYCQMQGLVHAATQFHIILKGLDPKRPVDNELRDEVNKAIKALAQQKTVIMASFGMAGRGEQAVFELMKNFFSSGSTHYIHQTDQKRTNIGFFREKMPPEILGDKQDARIRVGKRVK